MNNSVIIFFENQKISWNRFPKLICEKINGIDTLFIYNVEDDTLELNLFSDSFCYKGDLNPILGKLKSYNEIKLILFAFRPIDLFFLTHLKQEIPNCKSLLLK